MSETPTEGECEHEMWDFVSTEVDRCVSCGLERQVTAADYGGPDTIEEARGEK